MLSPVPGALVPRAVLLLVGLATACLLLASSARAQRPLQGLDIASRPVDATWVGARPTGSNASFKTVAGRLPTRVSLPLPGLPEGGRCDLRAECRGWLWSYSGEVPGVQLGGLGADAYVLVEMQAHLNPMVLPLGLILLGGPAVAAWTLMRRGRTLEKQLHQVKREKQIMAETKSRDNDLPPLIGRTLESEHGRSMEILRLVGFGSMGAVFEAVPRGKDASRGETWAVKVPFRATLEEPDSRRRFLREAEICTQLPARGMVAVLDWGWYHAGPREDERGWPFMVMEMMTGETLRDVLKARGREGLPVGLAKRWLEELVEAVSVMHKHGVVHRDLKPENVFVSHGERVKIGDFGVAGRMDSHTMTVAGDALGTPLYMSPEHLEAASTTPQSDIYSLGVIGYEMLCGHPPFEAENVFTVLNRILNEEAPPISASRPDVPPGLDRLILSMMAKDATRRPTAERILLSLRRFADERVFDAEGT